MIVEGRAIAVILMYIFTLVGYLLGRTAAIEENEIKIKHERLKLIVALLEKIKTNNKEN